MASFVADDIFAAALPDRASILTSLVEDQWFERKSVRIASKDLAPTLIAFANAEGGTVVIGVHNGTVEDVSELPQKMNEFRQTAIDLTVPPVRTSIKMLDVIDKAHRAAHLMLISIEPSEQVHETSRGDCYLRVGDETRRLTFEQRQELVYDRGATKFDGQAAGGVHLSDLSEEFVNAYVGRLGTNVDVRRAFTARGLLTRAGEVTVAGHLLFHDHPQAEFPQAFVRVLRFLDIQGGTGRRQRLDAAGDVRIEGALPHVISESAATIENWLPRVRALGDSGTFEDRSIIPRDAWLEALVNAVVHRSYSMSGDHIRVSLFPDRIEVESPGRFPGIADPRRPLDISRFARNPRIARVCSDLYITQELGEGIRRIFDEMRALDLTDPVYVQTQSTVRVTLTSAPRLDPRVAARLPVGSADVIRVLREADRPLGTGDVMSLVHRSRPWVTGVLSALREEGQVAWNGKSPSDPRAAWSLPGRNWLRREP